jgi:hypothetical protein
MQRAGLFPTFELMFMFSRVRQTNDLHQILVGVHLTILFSLYLLLPSIYLFHAYQKRKKKIVPVYLLSYTFFRTIKIVSA